MTIDPEFTAAATPSRRTLRRGKDLVAAGAARADDESLIDQAGAIFPVQVTAHLAERMAAEPRIARQFVPTAGELQRVPSDRADAIGDDRFSPVKGVVHRYPDRALLKPLLACPAYCRFCFRREGLARAQGDALLSDAELDEAIAYIANRDAIWEVILSGGDPLMLSPARLGEIVRRLSRISHLEVIRIHTRVPVLDPARVTGDLVAALETEKAMFVVLHCNHAAELSAAARAACRTIQRGGIPMLSQTVLLKGVNDDGAAMEALMRTLVSCRIKPYYLHHPDLVPGTAHFRPEIAGGRALMRGLRGRVSGLCQPTYVLDIPDGHGKVPVGPSYLTKSGDSYEVLDWQGRAHPYPPHRGEPDVAAGGST